MIRILCFMLGVGAGFGLALPSSHRSPVTTASLSTGAVRETLLERGVGGHFQVHGIVDDQLVRFVVDTGADTVALTVEDARRIGIPFTESEFTVIGRSASGDLLGKEVTLASVSVDGKLVTQVRALICQGLDISLLGQSYLSRISAVQMNGDYMTLR